MSPKHHILTNKGKLLRTVMLTRFPRKKHKLFQNIYVPLINREWGFYVLTEQ